MAIIRNDKVRITRNSTVHKLIIVWIKGDQFPSNINLNLGSFRKLQKKVANIVRDCWTCFSAYDFNIFQKDICGQE